MRTVTSASLAVTLCFGICFSVCAADLPGTGADTGKTVVYRDTLGVPHIYAPTVEAGMSAMGWAILACCGVLLFVFGMLLWWASDAEKKYATANAELDALKKSLVWRDRAEKIATSDVLDEDSWVADNDRALQRLRDIQDTDDS